VHVPSSLVLLTQCAWHLASVHDGDSLLSRTQILVWLVFTLSQRLYGHPPSALVFSHPTAATSFTGHLYWSPVRSVTGWPMWKLHLKRGFSL
jgi:hypothetical protein